MIQSNLERYKNDLEKLSSQGKLLELSMKYAMAPDIFREVWGEKSEKLIENLPNFEKEYQSWYSEAKSLIRQLLPDRLSDFARYYEKPKTRRQIDAESYRIEDYLQGISVTRGIQKEEVVGREAAIPHFQQQLAILKSVSARFESSLFDIRQLVQADLLDSELDAARELLRKGFLRAGGVVSGVVLERHLGQVITNHSISMRKKRPTISDLNDALKGASIIDTPTWRQIQRLGDLRNICAHDSDREPTKDEVQELISGVEKFTKILF